MKSDLLVVRVEPEIAQALAQRKHETGVPTSEFVRRAVIQALQGPSPVEYRSEERHAEAAKVLVATANSLRKAEADDAARA